MVSLNIVVLASMPRASEKIAAATRDYAANRAKHGGDRKADPQAN
jgi:hypothetical protein